MASPSGPEDPSRRAMPGASPARRDGDSGWGAPRDVPPPRPLPRPPRRRPALRSSDAVSLPSAKSDEGGHEDEPPWLRARREEHEFAREFGEWRAGGMRPVRRSGVGAAVLLRVLVLAVLLAVVVLILLR